MNWERFGRKRQWPNQHIVSEFACRDIEKPRKTAVRLYGAPPKTGTRNIARKNRDLPLHHHAGCINFLPCLSSPLMFILILSVLLILRIVIHLPAVETALNK